MKALINRVLGLFGYQVRRLPEVRGQAALASAGYPVFESVFNSTEGSISLDEGHLLFRLAKELSSGCIVEVGSWRGRSAVALGCGSLAGHGVPVFAVDPHEPFIGILGGQFGPEDRGRFYRAMLASGCYRIVRLLNVSSEVITPGWTRTVGLLWIDGDHAYDGVKRDFDCWLPHLAKNGLLAFDDSTDPALGPRRLINELTASGVLCEVETVGKVTVLRLGTGRATQI